MNSNALFSKSKLELKLFLNECHKSFKNNTVTGQLIIIDCTNILKAYSGFYTLPGLAGETEHTLGMVKVMKRGH